MVYFITDGEYVKIGHSSSELSIPVRLRYLQTGNARDLTLLGVMIGSKGEEKEIHQLFRRYHYKREWFVLSKNIRRFICNQTRPLTPILLNTIEKPVVVSDLERVRVLCQTLVGLSEVPNTTELMNLLGRILGEKPSEQHRIIKTAEECGYITRSKRGGVKRCRLTSAGQRFAVSKEHTWL